jgi:hypothetical protein
MSWRPARSLTPVADGAGSPRAGNHSSTAPSTSSFTGRTLRKCAPQFKRSIGLGNIAEASAEIAPAVNAIAFLDADPDLHAMPAFPPSAAVTC